MTWLKIFDASGSWPIDPAACWADGYRVIAGYAGSQSWKTFTPAMLAKWVTPAHPFGIAAMYEGTGREAFNANSATFGRQHAIAARTAWRALGMPDTAAIAYAVDTDANSAQIRGPIARYFQAVRDNDTCPPISYLENDGSEYLATKGITAGGFIPAAYSWGDPPVLMTPANALSHAVWLQEHNGVALHGGDVDTGHIRDDAPIWWHKETIMAGFDAGDAHFLFTYRGLPADNPTESLGTAILEIQRDTAKIDDIATALDALKGTPLTAKLDQILAILNGGAVPAPTPGQLSDADVQRIAAATAGLLYLRLAAAAQAEHDAFVAK